jgi:hypothetical protein
VRIKDDWDLLTLGSQPVQVGMPYRYRHVTPRSAAYFVLDQSFDREEGHLGIVGDSPQRQSFVLDIGPDGT